MKRSSFLVGALVVACTFPFATALSGQDASHPIIGVWALDTSASSYEPGPGPRGMMRRFFEIDDGYVVSIRITVGAQGNPNFAMVRLKMDGEDYEVWTTPGLGGFIETGDRPTATASFSPVDDRTLSLLQKNNGEPGPLSPNTWQVSEDGSTLTVTTHGTTADGTAVHNVEVFNRVEDDS